MKAGDVRSIGKPHCIKPERHSKTELINTIQTDQGNYTCANSGGCDDQSDYPERRDCLDTVQNNKRKLS
ncbi:MAG: hypothetical protein WCA63_13595 [Gallionella sp.]